ncbi:MAG: SulP family inorganic anion transporter [Thermoleophilaceae bacterium]|nr:SulP family inorganic anion transporter [Thermoleophilaceae bacterium]
MEPPSELRRQLGKLLPSRRDYEALPHTWRTDLIAGVTVGVVALPLALAFGVASGLGASAGLITAIVAGTLAAVFGGSHVQVSGPTGAMTVVLAPVVLKFGIDGVLVVTALAGIMLIAAGAIRLGRLIRLLPWPLIEGFTLGIGAIIFLQQVPVALGVPMPDNENTAVRALAAIADAGAANWHAIALSLIVAIAMIAIPRIHRSAPASLLGVAAATLIAVATGWQVSEIGTIATSLPAPNLPGFNWGELSGLLGAAVSIAALAAIESLLSARVADGMADTDHHDPDRELVGQGVANLGSSLFGGMPATGAIARTAVNVRAGGRTRAAAIVHSAVLVVVMLVLSPLVASIPLAALAGVLMVTAVHMVEFGTIGRILRSTRGDAAVLLTTAFATLAFDLVVAVEIGLVIAILVALHSVASETRFEEDDLRSVDIDVETEHQLLHDHVVVYQLDGALFFGAAQRFLLELADVSDVRWAVLRLGKLRVLDATGARAIGDLVERLESRGISVILTSVRAEHRRLIDGVGAMHTLDQEHRIVPGIQEALAMTRSSAPDHARSAA